MGRSTTGTRHACSIVAVLVATAIAAPAAGQAPAPPHDRAPATQQVRDVAAANNAFALDLFAQLRAGREPGDNLMVSPLSISTALTMAYAGARHNTAAQMSDVLRYGGMSDDDVHAGYGQLLGDLNASRPGYQLDVVNGLFAQQGYSIGQQFLDRLANDYGAPPELVDFIADPEVPRLAINQWVADNTNQRIKDLLPSGSVTTDTRLVLANAVYFNGQWKHKFADDLTHPAPFYLSGGAAATTPTMFQSHSFPYGEFDGFQMLEMPYAGDDLSMVVMLPNERDGLADLESALTAELFHQSVDSLVDRDVNVRLPKFTFRDQASLGGPLQAMGMTDAFSNPDFSGIAEGLGISGVFHQTFIDFHEQGTEAAGATGVVIGVTSVPPPPAEFRADHPFLFALRDRHTGAVLFLGRMADPGAATAAAAVPEPNTAALLVLSLGAIAWRRRATRAY